MTNLNDTKLQQPAGLIRRFAAMVYDALLIIAVLFLVFAIALAIVKQTTGADLVPNAVGSVLVVLVLFGFFALFWKRGGQTLGMQTWKLHLENKDGAAITMRQCALRFIGALLAFATGGLGYLWLLFDKEKRALPDILSGSQVFYRPKEKKKKAD